MLEVKNFILNGQHYKIDFEITILDLINYFNYSMCFFVLEYNNFICNKKDWKNIFIKDNDKIEIITIVGGG